MVELYGDVVIQAVRDVTYIFAGITGRILVPTVVWTTREFDVVGVLMVEKTKHPDLVSSSSSSSNRHRTPHHE
jgi:hypothetical protein